MNRRKRKKQLKNKAFSKYVNGRIKLLLGGITLPINIFNRLRRSQLKKTLPFFLVPLNINDKKCVGFNKWIKAKLPYVNVFSILKIKNYLKSLSPVILNPPNQITNQSPALLGLEDNLNVKSSKNASPGLEPRESSVLKCSPEESSQENPLQQMKLADVLTISRSIIKRNESSGLSLRKTTVGK